MADLPPKHIGLCIFCGGLGETNDHVIPKALGGVDVLGKSSCESCRDILNRTIDAPVINGPILGASRIQFNRPRSKKRRAPTHTKVLYLEKPLEKGKSSKAVTDNVPIEDLPRIMMLYTSGRPGIITGEILTDGYVIDEIYLYNGNFGKIDSKFTMNSMSSTYEYEAFLRMVAKVGHAAAYLILERVNFESFIPSALRDHSINIRKFVGSGPKLSRTDMLNRVSIREEGLFIIASVQLFADLGMPNYDVVLGRRPGWAIFAG